METGRLGSPGKEKAGGREHTAVSVHTHGSQSVSDPPLFNPSALQLCSS